MSETQHGGEGRGKRKKNTAATNDGENGDLYFVFRLFPGMLGTFAKTPSDRRLLECLGLNIPIEEGRFPGCRVRTVVEHSW